MNIKQGLPMKNYFTPDEIQPSEHTLCMIRQIAYTYRVIRDGRHSMSYCLN